MVVGEQVEKKDRFSIDVPGYGDVSLSEFGIDDGNILDELSEQPGFYAFWYSQENQAYKLYQEARLAAKIMRAHRHKYYRTEYDWAEEYDKRPTNEDIKQLVEGDDQVVQAERELIENRFRYQQMKAVREALQQRKDMLNSVGGIRRTEMTFGPNRNG